MIMDTEGSQVVIPKKSPNDERSYEALQLANGLKVVLVHDEKAEKGACAISVGVGSLMDGERSLGLAHFLEHMLFMGSRKFPGTNEYSEFISINSGYDNAYTSDQETTYFFEIASSKFPECVERISDFFVEALLSEECINKERQAVHEECMLRCSEDNSRKWEILKHFASGPYHNHSIGNNSTLSHPQVRDDLVAFYQREYSANRICAALISSIPIEEMKQKLLPFMAEIKNKELPQIKYQLHFEQPNLGKLIKLDSIKDEAIIEFFWVIDSTRTHKKHHIGKYIGHVLGHQGKNSLLSLLKSQDYSSELSSYTHDMPRQTIVGLEIKLTEHGQENFDKVYNLVVDYCSWFKAEKHVYQQIKETSELNFRFKEKQKNSHYVTTLVSAMHQHPLEQILSHSSDFADYDATVIDHYLQQINPFNLLLVYSNTHQLEDPITEPHLGGKFKYEPLPDRVNSKVKFESLRPNPFLPADTNVLPVGSQIPSLLAPNVLYARGDFPVCKGGLKLRIHSDQTDTFREFYGSYLSLLLKEVTYDAECLRLDVQTEDEYQLQITMFGFSHTVLKLLQQVGGKIANAHRGEQGEKIFELCLQDMAENLGNFYENDTDEIVTTLQDIILLKGSSTVQEAIQETENYEYDDICKRIDAFWAKASLDWVVVGNFDSNGLVDFLRAFEQKLDCSRACPPAQIGCLIIDRPLCFVKQLQSPDIGTSGCVVQFELGKFDQVLNCKLRLLESYIKEPFFDQLRTQQQLAYYLTAYRQNNRGILSLNFLLISSNANPSVISQRIRTFIQQFYDKINEDLTEEKFDTLKNSLRTEILQPHTNLNAFYDFVCREVDLKTYNFQRKQKEQLEGYLSQVKRNDLKQLLEKCLGKALQVWVVAQPHEEEYKKQKAPSTVTVDEIRKKCTYHEDKHSTYQL